SASPIGQPGAARTSISAIDTTSHRVVATAVFDPPRGPSGGPETELEAFALSTDGSRLYVGLPFTPDAKSSPGAPPAPPPNLDPGDLHKLSAIPVPLALASRPLFPPQLVPDSGRLYGVTQDGNLAVVDASTGALVTEVALPGDLTGPPSGPSIANPFVLSPSQTVLAIGDVLIDLESNRILGRVFEAGQNDSAATLFSGAGSVFFSLSRMLLFSPVGPSRRPCRSTIADLAVVAVDPTTLQVLGRIPLGHADGARLSTASSLDGRRLTIVVRPERRGSCPSSPELLVAGIPEGAI